MIVDVVFRCPTPEHRLKLVEALDAYIRGADCKVMKLTTDIALANLAMRGQFMGHSSDPTTNTVTASLRLNHLAVVTSVPV